MFKSWESPRNDRNRSFSSQRWNYIDLTTLYTVAKVLLKLKMTITARNYLIYNKIFT